MDHLISEGWKPYRDVFKDNHLVREYQGVIFDIPLSISGRDCLVTKDSCGGLVLNFNELFFWKDAETNFLPLNNFSDGRASLLLNLIAIADDRKSQVCTCELPVLMRCGCQCGGR
jgi:hypothetical protein